MKKLAQKHNLLANKVLDLFETYFPTKQETLHSEDFLSNPVFATLMRNAPGIFCLLNFQTREYLYVSESVKKFFGIEPELLLNGGLPVGISFLPEEQQHIFAEKLFPNMAETCAQYAALGQVKDLRFTYTTFIKTSSGAIKNFMHQITVVEEDQYHFPLLGIKFVTDIDSIKKDSNVDYEVAKYDAKDHLYKVLSYHSYPCVIKGSHLTTREIEIARMIGEGKSSKEIADKICLSRYTVDNHRRNMMRKMQVANTSQLLQTISKQGML